MNGGGGGGGYSGGGGADGEWKNTGAGGYYPGGGGGSYFSTSGTSLVQMSGIASPDGSNNGYVQLSIPASQPATPKITSFTRSGSTDTIYFTTTSAAIYALYYTNSAGLNTSVSNWPSSSTLIGDGGTDHLSDTSMDASRFYRVGAHNP